MFEIGWTEMLVIAVVMIVVVGPKDLPRMLRTFGKFAGKVTSMAGDFRKQFDEAMKEAELDDVRKSFDDIRALNPKNEIRKALSPMEKAAADVRAGLDGAMRPKSQASATSGTGEAIGDDLGTLGTAGDMSYVPAAGPQAPVTVPPALQPVASPAVPADAVPAKVEAAVADAPAAALPRPRAKAKAAAEPRTAPKAADAPRPKVARAKPAGASVPSASADKPARTRKTKQTGTAT